ncbi:hypothetical protein A0R60_4743 [Enterobacter asburiae]|nr:hypothetical protein A0R60_4743 [Enterobacter asburiae]
MNLDLDLLRTFVAVADLNTLQQLLPPFAELSPPLASKCSGWSNWSVKSFLHVTDVISS